MADNLLDKASILLTPTAYDNGSMLSVKPENGDGDFQFQRNSAATRVNAQGLVENVQIISPELVSNGNFSQIGTEEVLNGDFSQEGSELVTNGDFATDSDWTKGTGWTIENGQAVGLNATGNLSQSISFTNGKTYKITFEVSNYTSGQVRLQTNEQNSVVVSANGIYTEYLTMTTDSSLIFNGIDGNPFNGSIDNVSVKEVGQNWDLGSGWSIGEDKATSDGSSNNDLRYETTFNPSILKIKFDVNDLTQGGVRLFVNTPTFTQLINATSNGSYETTVEVTSGANNLYFYSTNNFIGSVSNISVKEVGQDWSLGTGWSIGDDVAIFNDTTTNRIFQTGLSIISGKKYKIGFTIADCPTTAHMTIYDAGGSDLILPNENYVNGDYTRYYTATTNETGVSFWGNTAGDTFTISNISVKEITDDTNIPRINYEG